jgi:hypothetical protein
MTTQEKKEQIAHGKSVLEKYLVKGSKIFTTINHVSKSGCSRSISCLTVRGEEIVDISPFVAFALGKSFDQKNGGVKITGGGMCMSHHLVECLSYAIFGIPSELCYSRIY